MIKGHLSQYFIDVAYKKLSAVEASSHRSNQHEFNGVGALKNMLGTEKHKYSATFIYLCDDDAEPIKDDGFLTWYDAREGHLTRTEYRLYFPTTLVSMNASEGDLLVIARKPDDSLLLIVAESESTIESQILWLFNVDNITHPGFSIKGEIESDQIKLEFASRYILEQIGITIEETSTSYLDQMLIMFDGKFPPTRVFSDFARSTTTEINPILDNPDEIIMAWVEREEILFRTLERHLIGSRLQAGFGTDVDEFISFSLSVQNRRKSRAGGSLENHIENLFIQKNIKYSRTPITEGRAKPDFIFPNINEYRNQSYPAQNLTMLGVKSSCKDRWRQILPEANRVNQKHLFTLEPGISENQTNEMKEKNVQLILPTKIQESYTLLQRDWLMNFATFLELVKVRQNQSGK